MNIYRTMYPMQLNWQIAQLQRFWLVTASTTALLVSTTWLESLKLSGITKGVDY